jgi:hypothetical protein
MQKHGLLLPAPLHGGHESRGHCALTPTRGPGESTLQEPSKCIRKRMHPWICTGNKYYLFKITKSCLSRVGTINRPRGLMGYAYMSVIPRPHLRTARRCTPQHILTTYRNARMRTRGSTMGTSSTEIASSKRLTALRAPCYGESKDGLSSFSVLRLLKTQQSKGISLRTIVQEIVPH